MNKTLTSALFGLLCLQTLAPLQAQRTWIVSEGRLPRDFTDFPPAVAAAQPGDTILLRRGVYTSAVIDKGITVMQDSTWNSAMPVQVANVPAGQRVALVFLTGLFPVSIVNCEGEVIVYRLDTNPFIAGGPGRPTTIENCRLVSWTQSYGYDFSIRSSRVVLVESIAQILGSAGRAALRLVDSDVTLANCAVRTFDVSYPQPAPSPLPSVPAIEMNGGRLVIAGSGRVWGARICCDYSVNPPVIVPSPAIVSNGGVVEVDPATWLSPAGGTVGSSSFTQRYQPTCEMLAFPPPTSSPSIFPELTATPGATVFLLASLPVEGTLSSPWGDFWLDPTPGYAMVLAQGITDATGTLSLVLPLSRFIPPGMMLRSQGVVVEPSGEIRLTTPDTSVMVLY